MAEVRVTVSTAKSVQQCATTFEHAVKASYGGARKLLRGVSAIRGGPDSGGIDFFRPPGGGDWSSGAMIPGYSKMHGATKMAVHVYVTDRGREREVQLVGPYGIGDKGSTERLIRSIAQHF